MGLIHATSNLKVTRPLLLSTRDYSIVETVAGNGWEETAGGESWATRQKDLPSLLAGQFSSVCDAMMSHADANHSFVYYILPPPFRWNTSFLEAYRLHHKWSYGGQGNGVNLECTVRSDIQHSNIPGVCVCVCVCQIHNY